MLTGEQLGASGERESPLHEAVASLMIRKEEGSDSAEPSVEGPVG